MISPGPTFLVDEIEASLNDDKAEDVLVIDMQQRSSIADYLVIASGNSNRHLSAMAQHLAARLKTKGTHSVIEGLSVCDWVLIDAGDVIVHLFRPEVRVHYGIERIWGLRRGVTNEAEVSPV